jgi:hypothetical protein
MRVTSRNAKAFAIAAATPSSGSIANAQKPLGGQPPPGARQSVSDLDAQVAYQRAFEAVLWAIDLIAFLQPGRLIPSRCAVLSYPLCKPVQSANSVDGKPLRFR